MSSRIIAVLGGDAREVRVAERLAALGNEVRLFGVENLATPTPPLSASALEAVTDANWLVCPAPGIDGDRLYAPFAAEPLVLDNALLSASSITTGGIIMGRASTTVREQQARIGFRVIETKDERHLAIANATSVSEGLLRLLIERTDQTLRELRIVVLGYGATGAAIVDSLVGARCRPAVVARSKVARERARQVGAEPVSFDDRVKTMLTADIVVNTVPATDAIPADAFARLGTTMVVDIASPPGGVDHDAARAAGVDVVWARGLGSRAPLSSGDIRFGFIEAVLNDPGATADGHPA